MGLRNRLTELKLKKKKCDEPRNHLRITRTFSGTLSLFFLNKAMIFFKELKNPLKDFIRILGNDEHFDQLENHFRNTGRFSGTKELFPKN